MKESYELIFKPSVKRDLKHPSGKLVSSILRKIEDLKGNPFPPQSLKLSGTEGLYRIRVGNYRIIYEVSTEERLITIHYIRHRSEVYKKI